MPFNVPIFRNVCFQNYLKEYWIYTRGIIFAIEWRLMFATHSHKVLRHSRLLNCMRAHTRDQASPLMKFNLMGLPYLNLASTPDHSYYPLSCFAMGLNISSIASWYLYFFRHGFPCISSNPETCQTPWVVPLNFLKRKISLKREVWIESIHLRVKIMEIEVIRSCRERGNWSMNI